MPLLDTFRRRVASGLAEVKSFSPSTVGQVGGSFGGNFGGRFSGSWGGSSGALAGTNLNYAALVGDVWQNSAVAACLNWMLTAFPEAPPCLKEVGDNGKTSLAADSLGVTRLLESPNPSYDDTVLWAGTLLSFVCAGNAYWFKVRDGAGRVKELWYVPHFQVVPRWKGDDFISYYEYHPGGNSQIIPVEDVIHFRFGVDPYNPRLGMAPLSSVLREIYTDTQATNYSAAILRNFGSPGVIISPKDSKTAGFDPTVDSAWDAQSLAKLYKAKTTGDQQGEPLVLDGAVDVNFPSNSPESMALDVIRKYPEARICAVMGIPAMVVGLNVGLERSTFSNYAEARSAAWEDCLLPIMRVMGRQATGQLLRVDYPQAEKFVIGFNTAEVRALSEDTDAKHTRAREDYKAGLLDRAESKAEIGMATNAEDEGHYAPSAKSNQIESAG